MVQEDKIKEKLIRFQQGLDDVAEPAWEENKTVAYIKEKLGKPYWEKKTALIYRVGKGTPIFFRTELDATGTEDSMKHVCGHDAHTAAMMGTYLYFKENPPTDKTIYFVFQPSQEGYLSGAAYITEHFSEIKTCKAGFTIHVWPTDTEGELLDVRIASCDYVEIKVTGQSTHLKNKIASGETDPIAMAGKIVYEINKAKHPDFLVYIGSVVGGETPNAHIATVKLTGDMRSNDEKGRLNAYQFLRETLDIIEAEAQNIAITTDYFMGYPTFESNKDLREETKKIFPINQEAVSYGFGGTDDFSLYPVPGMTLHIGTGRKEKLHTPEFFVPNGVTEKIYDCWIKIGKHHFAV